VALLVDDGPEFVFWFMGALRYGAIPVPLNTFADAQLLHFYLADSRARLLVANLGFREVVTAARRMGLPYLCHVIWVEDETYEMMTATPPPVFEADDDDSAVWLYTSGSTSKPKAAMHRHASLVQAGTHYGRGVLDIGRTDRTYSTSKLFFAYGLGNSLLFPFCVGASTVLVGGRSDADGVLDTLDTHRPTLFFSVPALYSRLAESVRLTPQLVESVRVCVSAGESLPESVLRKWQRATGRPILDGIGSTEAGHIFCSNTLDGLTPGTSGRPVNGYRLRIVDGECRDVPLGEVGQLMVTGDTIAKGYWNRHRLSQLTFRGEWLATGDLYCQDERGQFIFVGRTDDAFKVSGQWVSPVEIEHLLLAREDIDEAAVVGIKGTDGLTKAKAVVVRRSGMIGVDTDDFTAELRSYLRERLPGFKVPSVITELAVLPKTATGKVARATLRAGHLATEAGSANGDDQFANRALAQ
jgi:benzoate-CoA ligase family protein